MKELSKRSLQTDPKREVIRRSSRAGETGRPAALTNLLQLHRTVGNRAVGRLLQHTLQRTSDDKAQSSSVKSAMPDYYFIPDCESDEEARDIFSRISLGDSDALQSVSQQAYESYKDKQQSMEWGLARKGGQFILIPGKKNGAVTWAGIDSMCDPIAHSHPKKDPGETKREDQESDWVSHFKKGKPISKDMKMEHWHLTYPTQSDILYPALIKADSHRVYTPWQVQQDRESTEHTALYNPECKPEEQLVFEIINPRKTAYLRIKNIMGIDQRPSDLYICDMRVLQGSNELFILHDVKANTSEPKSPPAIGESLPDLAKEVPAEQEQEDGQEEGDPFADFSSVHS